MPAHRAAEGVLKRVDTKKEQATKEQERASKRLKRFWLNNLKTFDRYMTPQVAVVHSIPIGISYKLFMVGVIICARPLATSQPHFGDFASTPIFVSWRTHV